jgi:type II secretory pathway component PulF
MFTAVDISGGAIRGEELADNRRLLQQQLLQRGLLLVDAKGISLTSRRGKMRQSTLLVLTQSIAAFLEAGMPLIRALDAAGESVPARAAPLLLAVRREVERGCSLSEAMESHKPAFPVSYIAVVRGGEAGGALADAFSRLATSLEKSTALRGRLLTALLYPCVIIVVGAIAALVLVLGVLPTLAEVLIDSGATIPASTRALLSLATFIRQNWLSSLLTALTLAGVARASVAVPSVRMLLSKWTLRLPILNSLLRQLAALRFSSQMNTLLSTGTPLLTALDTARASSPSKLVQAELTGIFERIKAGSSLHRALAACNGFPVGFAQIIASGESSGRLAESFAKSASYFQNQLERTLNRTVTLVEPILIVLFGVLVGAVALSLMQAIYSVNAGTFK